MGRDKALLEFRGRPLVEWAVASMRRFCTEVSISGNREDLGAFAPVIGEARVDTGPGAGIEAGLQACLRPWMVFVPVDVPLVPPELLRAWVGAVLQRESEGTRLSFLTAGGLRQPTFCALHADCRAPVSRALHAGERKLGAVFSRVAGELGPGSVWVANAEEFAPGQDGGALEVASWFANLNTPEELAAVAVGVGSVAGTE